MELFGSLSQRYSPRMCDCCVTAQAFEATLGSGAFGTVPWRFVDAATLSMGMLGVRTCVHKYCDFVSF